MISEDPTIQSYDRTCDRIQHVKIMNLNEILPTYQFYLTPLAWWLYNARTLL